MVKSLALIDDQEREREMGSSYSCFVAGRRGTKKIIHQKEAQINDSDEKKGTEKINHQKEAKKKYSDDNKGTKKINHQKKDSDEKKPPKKHTFVWKIDGFESLLELGEGTATATSFQMWGITWNLFVNPMDRKSGDVTGSEKHMSLDLAASPSSYSPNYMLETKFKFFIHNQNNGKHIEREVSHTYMTTSRNSRVSSMILLETLKNPSSGFLLNDSIAVGVELIECKKVPFNGVETISFIPKNKSSGSFSWYIEEFSQLSRPFASSEPFQIAGYTWKLHLQPESVSDKNYVGLYLILEDKSGSQLPPSSGVIVDAVFYIKRQSQGVLADDDPLSNKFLDPYQYEFRYNFTPSGTTWGYPQFIRLEEFENPSNGYLIKGTCTIEASLCIFGSGNDRST